MLIIHSSSATSAPNALLPLTIANNWTPEVFICGSTAPSVNLDGNPSKLSSQTNTSKNCYRMAITTAGIAKGWVVEAMPEARMMGDMVLTPDGKVNPALQAYTTRQTV